MTQRVLADKLKKPQSFAAKVEGSERMIDVIGFVAIVRALGAEPITVLSTFLRKRRD